jgi:hypothetical protein
MRSTPAKPSLCTIQSHLSSSSGLPPPIAVSSIHNITPTAMTDPNLSAANALLSLKHTVVTNWAQQTQVLVAKKSSPQRRKRNNHPRIPPPITIPDNDPWYIRQLDDSYPCFPPELFERLKRRVTMIAGLKKKQAAIGKKQAAFAKRQIVSHIIKVATTLKSQTPPTSPDNVSPSPPSPPQPSQNSVSPHSPSPHRSSRISIKDKHCESKLPFKAIQRDVKSINDIRVRG